MDTVIDKSHSGVSIKTYLHKTLGMSRAEVTALKKRADGITVGGAYATVRYILREGDILSLATEDTAPSDNIVPTEMALSVLYEDDDLIILDKPPLVPTHPSHGHYTDTLANGLAYLFEARGVPFVFRSCSRLDRDTSGVVTVAKNRTAASHFHKLHLEGKVQKEYLCVLCGTLTPEAGEISGNIRRKEESVIIREVCMEGGAPALTRYRVLAYGQAPDGAPLTLVSAAPVTGRTHQLRVHFASRGCPIMGDFLYGAGDCPYIGRQALHCKTTAFPHPITGQMLSVTAPPPKDISRLLSFFSLEV